jgi:hypothetical protein
MYAGANMGHPSGTSAAVKKLSAVPAGLEKLLGSLPRTNVLGYFQVVPPGLAHEVRAALPLGVMVVMTTSQTLFIPD